MKVAWITFAAILAGCASAPGDAPGAEVGPATPTALQVSALGDAHHGERFAPDALIARVGDTVTFRVEGATPHTVDFEETDGVRSPHSGNLDEGMTHAVTFDKPGEYRYYCQYHLPGMRGSITIRA